jgi:murein DD-endopeptidase MepM/ murein hydrolase activator NlpD
MPHLAYQKGTSGINGARFGMVRYGAGGQSKKHNGLDLRADVGTRLYAMYTGVVYEIGSGSGWGNYIKFLTRLDNKPVIIMYAHINKAVVREGNVVQAGQYVAVSGKSGNLEQAVYDKTVEAHVHIEVREFIKCKDRLCSKNNRCVAFSQMPALDPEDYLGTKLTPSGRPRRKKPCHEDPG